MFKRNKLNIDSIKADKLVNQIKKNVDKQLSKKQDDVLKLSVYAIKELIVEKYTDLIETALNTAIAEIKSDLQTTIKVEDEQILKTNN